MRSFKTVYAYSRQDSMALAEGGTSTHRREERHRNKPTDLHHRFLTEVQNQFIE